MSTFAALATAVKPRPKTMSSEERRANMALVESVLEELREHSETPRGTESVLSAQDTIDLSYLWLDASSTRAVVEAVQDVPYVRRLLLAGNSWNEDGVQALLTLMAKRQDLVVVDIDQADQLEDRDARALVECLAERNPSVQLVLNTSSLVANSTLRRLVQVQSHVDARREAHRHYRVRNGLVPPDPRVAECIELLRSGNPDACGACGELQNMGVGDEQLRDWLEAYETEYDRLEAADYDPVPLPDTLDLSGNCVTEDGVALLAETIPNGIHHVNLSNNVLLGDGAVESVVTMCKRNYPQVRGYDRCNFIRSVDLTDNPLIGNDSLHRIWELVTRWNAVEVRVNNPARSLDTRLLRRIHDHMELSLEERQMVVARHVLRLLKRNPSQPPSQAGEQVLFDKLSFQFHPLDDAFVADLCQTLVDNTYVTRVNLSNITTLGMPSWKSLAQLLRHNTHIQEVEVNKSSLDEEGLAVLEHVVAYENAVVRVYVDESELIGHERLQTFHKIQRDLKTRRYHFQDHQIRHHRLPLDPAFAKRLRMAELLCKQDKLDQVNGVLDFANLGVQAGQVKQIVDVLDGACDRGTVGVTLNLGGNGIGNAGLNILGGFLKRRKASRDMRHVSLQHNILVTDEGVEALMRALRRNTGLLTLTLDDNEALGNAAARSVIDTLLDYNAVLNVSMKSCRHVSAQMQEELERVNAMDYSQRREAAKERKHKRQVVALCKEMETLERQLRRIESTANSLTKSDRPTWNPSLSIDPGKPLPTYDALQDRYCTWPQKQIVRQQLQELGLLAGGDDDDDDEGNGSSGNRGRSTAKSGKSGKTKGKAKGKDKKKKKKLRPLNPYKFERVQVMTGRIDAEEVAFPKKLTRRGQKRVLQRVSRPTDSLAAGYT